MLPEVHMRLFAQSFPVRNLWSSTRVSLARRKERSQTFKGGWAECELASVLGDGNSITVPQLNWGLVKAR